MSYKVKEIIEQKKKTTYKEVAEVLVNEMKNNESLY